MPKLTTHFKNTLPSSPKWIQLSNLVWTINGQNPGPFTLNGTNTYLVGSGKHRILIDCGDGGEFAKKYIPVLMETMQRAGGCQLQEIIITHWHLDHLGGVPAVQDQFGEVPVRKYMTSQNEQLRLGDYSPRIDPYSVWPRNKFVPLKNGEIIKTKGATLTVLHTPGHTNDHVCLFLEEEKAMFCGDNVLGIGSCVFTNLHLYLNSLEKMKNWKPTRLYCGHGPVVEEAEKKLEQYIQHRQKRIHQVLNVLQEQDRVSQQKGSAYYLTAEDIARKIYGDTIPKNLLPAATNNTLLVLEKLKQDRIIQEKVENVKALEKKWILSSSSRAGKLTPEISLSTSKECDPNFWKYIPPNLLTLGNLVSGCLSIYYSLIKKNYQNASLWILRSIFFDILDGVVARLLHSTSRFGKIFDTIAGIISFGIAPGLLVPTYYWKRSIVAPFLLPLWIAHMSKRCDTILWRAVPPNVLTLGNLIAGCFSVYYSLFKKDYPRAVFWILRAIIFDILDGVVARGLQSTSPFGNKFDNITKIISFGIAPALLIPRYYWQPYFSLRYLE